MHVTRNSGFLGVHIEASEGKALVLLDEGLSRVCKAVDVFPDYDMQNIYEVFFDENTQEVILTEDDVKVLRQHNLL